MTEEPKYPAVEGGFVPPKKASAKFPTSQDAETIKKTRRKASIQTFKAKPLTPLTEFMIENDGSGKTTQELYEEFRKDCPHVYEEVANLLTMHNRITIQSCKRCFIMVKGVGKPTPKNRIGNQNEKD